MQLIYQHGRQIFLTLKTVPVISFVLPRRYWQQRKQQTCKHLRASFTHGAPDWGWEGQEEVQIQEFCESGSSDHSPSCLGLFRFRFLIRARKFLGISPLCSLSSGRDRSHCCADPSLPGPRAHLRGCEPQAGAVTIASNSFQL